MTDAEKISKILKIKGLNVAEAERFAGIKGTVLANLIKRDGALGEFNREKVIRMFHVKREWWHTGQGEIFEENPTLVSEPEPSFKKSSKTIPFYDTIAVGGSAMLADQSPITEAAEYVDPGDFFRKATGIITVYGHSGFPKYPAGCKVAFKDADKDLIFWGEDYVIETSDRRIIKRLEKHEDNNFVRGVSYNKSDSYVYADMDIPRSKIKRLLMVLGKIELEASI